MLQRVFAPIVIIGLACASCRDEVGQSLEAEAEVAALDEGAAPVPVDPREARKAQALRGLSFVDGRVQLSAPLLEADPEEAAVAHERGLDLRTRNVSLEAIELHARAVRLAPDSAQFYRGLGDALLCKKGWEGKARDAFRTGLELEPESLELRARLADAQWRVGELEAAREGWERTLEIDPEFAEAHVRLAQAAFLSGQDEQAWDRIHAAEASGAAVPAQMRAMLAERSPEPTKERNDR